MKSRRSKVQYMSFLYKFYASMSANCRQPADDLKLLFVIAPVLHSRIISRCKGDMGKDNVVAKYALDSYKEPMGISENQLSKLFPKDFKSSMPTIEELEKGLKDSID